MGRGWLPLTRPYTNVWRTGKGKKIADPQGADRVNQMVNGAGTRPAPQLIIRMKQHIGHVARQVEVCLVVPKEIKGLLKKHLIQCKSARTAIQREKKSLLQSINLRDENEDDDDDDIFELNKEEMEALERKQYK